MNKPKNLFGDMKRAQEEMEHLMRHVFGQPLPLLQPLEGKWRPNVDVFEYEDHIVVVAELAGVERADVSLVFDDGKLRLTGIRRDKSPCGGRKYCQMEINYHEFERVIYMPDNVDVDRISAKLDSGFMIIEAPKKKPDGPKSHQVEIR